MEELLVDAANEFDRDVLEVVGREVGLSGRHARPALGPSGGGGRGPGCSAAADRRAARGRRAPLLPAVRAVRLPRGGTEEARDGASPHQPRTGWHAREYGQPNRRRWHVVG